MHWTWEMPWGRKRCCGEAMLALGFREGKGRDGRSSRRSCLALDGRGRAFVAARWFPDRLCPRVPAVSRRHEWVGRRVRGGPCSAGDGGADRNGTCGKGPIGFVGAIEDGLGGCAGVRDEPVCRPRRRASLGRPHGRAPFEAGSQAGLEAVAPGSCRSACGEMDAFDASGTTTLNGPKSLDSRSHCGRGYGLDVLHYEHVRFGSSARTTPRLTAIPGRAQAGGDASHDAPRSCRGFSSAYRANGPSASSRVLGRRLCGPSRETSLAVD